MASLVLHKGINKTENIGIIRVYPDDTVEQVVIKVLKVLKTQQPSILPYIWTHKSPLNVGYADELPIWWRLNPFECDIDANDDNSMPSILNPQYRMIGKSLKVLHVALASDIPEKLKAWYVPFKRDILEENIGNDLVDDFYHVLRNKQDIPPVTMSYGRMNMDANVFSDIDNVRGLWKHMMTNAEAQVMRHSDGNPGHIDYKLYAKHGFSIDELEGIFYEAKVPNVPSVQTWVMLPYGAWAIITISETSRAGCFAARMLCSLGYSLCSWKEARQRTDAIFKNLGMKRPEWIPRSLAIRAVVKVQGGMYEKVTNALPRCIGIFQPVPGKAAYEFLRVEGKDKTKGKDERKGGAVYGHTFEVIKRIEGLQMNIEGYDFGMIDRLIMYMRALASMANTSDMYPKLFVQQQAKGKKLPIKRSSSEKQVKRKSSASNDSSKSEKMPKRRAFVMRLDDGSSSSGGGSMVGGAIGKAGHAYYVKRIRNLDPKIVTGTQYSSKCGTQQQPVVLSDNELKRIDEKYPGSYDSSIKYGTDPSKRYNYICPRIWCPESEVSLTYEQLAANGNRCPGPDQGGHGEEPIMLDKMPYWSKNQNKKHHIGFIRDNDSGICLPCCYKNPSRPEELRQCTLDPLKENGKDSVSHTTQTNTDTNANTNTNADTNVKTKKLGPVRNNHVLRENIVPPKGRLGKIPTILEGLLTPGCKDKERNCVYRKGIDHVEGPKRTNHSFMNAIAALAGLDGGRSELLRMLQKRLGLYEFVVMGNGRLIDAFYGNGTVSSKELKAWMRNHPRDAVAFAEVPERRVNSIWMARRRFLEHIASGDTKSPHIGHYMCELLGFSLVIWDRTGDEAYLVCPPDSRPDLDSFAMVLKTDDTYEPMVLGKSGEFVMSKSADIYNNIKGYVASCGISLENSRVALFPDAFDAWAKQHEAFPGMYTIRGVVVSSDIRPIGLLLACGVLLSTPQLPWRSLARNPVPLLWREDVGQIHAMVSANQLDTLRAFARPFGVMVLPERTGPYDLTNVIPDSPIDADAVKPVMPTLPGFLRDFAEKERSSNSMWNRTARKIAAIVNKGINEPEAILNEFSKTRNNDIINMAQVLVADLFASQTKDVRNVDQWLSRELGIIQSWYSTEVKRINRGKSWGFTQAAVMKGLPREVLAPAVAPLPKDGLLPSMAAAIVQELVEVASEPVGLTWDKQTDVGSVVSLKWSTKLKGAAVWSPPNSITREDAFQDVASRICQELFTSPIDTSVVYKEGDFSYFNLASDAMRYTSLSEKRQTLVHAAMYDLISDPEVFAIWTQHMKRAKSKMAVIDGILDIESEYRAKLNNEQIVNIWKQVRDKTKPHTVDYEALARLLGVSMFIMLPRKPYGDGKEEGGKNKKRNGIEDMSETALFYKSARDNAPIALFYRTTEHVLCPIILNSANERLLHEQSTLQKKHKDIWEIIEVAMAKRVI